jgi:hypothetical protein
LDESWERLGHHVRTSLEEMKSTVHQVLEKIGAIQTESARRNTVVEMLQTENAELRREVKQLSLDVAGLKMTAAMIGGGAGLAIAVGIAFLEYLKK